MNDTAKELHIAYTNQTLEQKLAAQSRVQETANSMIRIFIKNILPMDILHLIRQNAQLAEHQTPEHEAAFKRVELIVSTMIKAESLDLSILSEIILMTYSFALELEALSINRMIE